jgi:hypothetical protein
VPGFIVQITGDGNGVFYTGFVCALAMLSAISQFVATLIQQAAASSVKRHFTVTQMDVLRLCCGQQGKHLCGA